MAELEQNVAMDQEPAQQEPEQEDGKEQLWEHGPTKEMLNAWKSRFKNVYLASFEEDERYVFRTLTRDEFKALKNVKGADQFYIEERMCDRCVLWPSKTGFQSMLLQKAGIPSSLSELIMEKSGFNADEVLLLENWVELEQGPTEEEFTTWKKRFGKLYAVEFEGDNVYIFRSLNRKEYKDMQKELKDTPDNMLYQEEKICTTCVMYPKNYDFTTIKKGLAGIPTTLSELIMSKSGFAATSVQAFE